MPNPKDVSLVPISESTSVPASSSSKWVSVDVRGEVGKANAAYDGVAAMSSTGGTVHMMRSRNLASWLLLLVR